MLGFIVWYFGVDCYRMRTGFSLKVDANQTAKPNLCLPSLYFSDCVNREFSIYYDINRIGIKYDYVIGLLDGIIG